MVDQEEWDWMEHVSKCVFIVEGNPKKCGLVKTQTKTVVTEANFTTNCQLTVCESLGRYISMTKRIEGKSW